MTFPIILNSGAIIDRQIKRFLAEPRITEISDLAEAIRLTGLEGVENKKNAFDPNTRLDARNRAIIVSESGTQQQGSYAMRLATKFAQGKVTLTYSWADNNDIVHSATFSTDRPEGHVYGQRLYIGDFNNDGLSDDYIYELLNKDGSISSGYMIVNAEIFKTQQETHPANQTDLLIDGDGRFPAEPIGSH